MKVYQGEQVPKIDEIECMYFLNDSFGKYIKKICLWYIYEVQNYLMTDLRVVLEVMRYSSVLFINVYWQTKCMIGNTKYVANYSPCLSFFLLFLCISLAFYSTDIRTSFFNQTFMFRFLFFFGILILFI